MELKRPRPLDDPPAASSSEEEEEQSEPEQDDEEESEQEKVEESEPEEQEENESEEEDEDDEEEDEDEKKNTQMKKTPISAINNNPQSSSSSETEDSDSQKSPRVSDFTVKPIAQPKSVEQQTPVSKPGKRRLENGKASEPKKAKAGVASGEEESGGGGKKGAINRLWSEDDEVDILKGVVEFQSEMGKDLSTHQVEFYEFMKGSLRVEVSKSQLMDKVRRLKKKYRNNVEKSINGEDPVFSKPHDYKCFQLSKKIWGNQNQSKKIANANDNAVDDDHVKSISSKKSSAKKSSASNKIVTVDEDLVKPISSKKSSASDKVVNVAVSGDTGFATKEEDFANGDGEKSEVADGKEDFAKLYPFLMNGFRFDDMPNVVDTVKRGISLVGSSELKELDSKWKKLSMAEVEISLERMGLMQELTRMVLDAMKSSKS